MSEANEKPEITPDILIEDLVDAYPESVSILMEYDVQCIACGEPVWGSLGEKIRSKNLDPEPVMEALHQLETEAHAG